MEKSLEISFRQESSTNQHQQIKTVLVVMNLLKIVADFLKFNPEVLNSALANFENKWKKIMGGNLS